MHLRDLLIAVRKSWEGENQNVKSVHTLHRLENEGRGLVTLIVHRARRADHIKLDAASDEDCGVLRSQQ